MFDRIRRYLADPARPEAAGDPDERLQVAAAALMVEAARMDDRLDAAERARIEELARWRFDLSEDQAEALVGRAAEASGRSAQWYGFTAVLRDGFDEGERVRLLEMIWDVIYADGHVHDLEASLMRRLAGLLYISDAECGAARKRVMARLGLAEG